MNRETEKRLDCLPDPELVCGPVSRARFEWLRDLLQRKGYLDIDLIYEESLRQRKRSPFFACMRVGSENDMVYWARTQRLRAAVCAIKNKLADSDEKFRTFVSVMNKNHVSRIEPTIWAERDEFSRRQLAARSSHFIRGWERHRANLARLQRTAQLRGASKPWRVPAPRTQAQVGAVVH